MSSLWTPGGERPVGRADAPATASAASAANDESLDLGPEGAASEDELMAQAAALRDQLAATPVEAIIAQFAYQLFEVAALHLSIEPPQLDQARLAIDAMAALLEGMKDRIGPDEVPLAEGLSQLRLAFVQISAAAKT